MNSTPFIQITILILLFFGCSEKTWHQQIEKMTEREIDRMEIGAGDDVACHLGFSRPYFEDPNTAFRVLLNTREFASCCVGIDAMPSMQALAYNVLLVQEDRKEIFLDLFERANPEGQLYALTAFYVFDYRLFLKSMEAAMEKSPEIRTAFGCIISGANYQDLLVSGYTHQHLLQGRPVLEWLKENPPSSRDYLAIHPFGSDVDIASGGMAINLKRVRDVAMSDRTFNENHEPTPNQLTNQKP
jgi:hypothetical protein